MIFLSFIAFMLLFLFIGLSARHNLQADPRDYCLASSSMSPVAVGLSAVSTNNSGYMFIGMIGYTYAVGLSSMWLMFGWVLGDFLASTFVHSRLRQAVTRSKQYTYAGVISTWWQKEHRVLRQVIGIISLIFLIANLCAQLLAGSKAVTFLFNLPVWGGAALVGIPITIYCYFGGLRGAMWSDVMQSVIMFFSMLVLLLISLLTLGGWEQVRLQMELIDGFLNWFPDDLLFPGAAGALVFIGSWVFSGLSTVAQPHIMVRFMAIKDPDKMIQARIWYYTWYALFSALAICVGLVSRIYLNKVDEFDQEIALVLMAKEMMPSFLLGMIVAGLFAAAMSTADALLLSCSTIITQDLPPKPTQNLHVVQFATILVSVIAFMFTIYSKETVFDLVLIAWSSLASAFTPLIFVLALGQKPSQPLSLFAIFVGLFVAYYWRYIDSHVAVYDNIVGVCAGLLVLLLGLVFQKKDPQPQEIAQTSSAHTGDSDDAHDDSNKP